MPREEQMGLSGILVRTSNLAASASYALNCSTALVRVLALAVGPSTGLTSRLVLSRRRKAGVTAAVTGSAGGAVRAVRNTADCRSALLARELAAEVAAGRVLPALLAEFGAAGAHSMAQCIPCRARGVLTGA